jgi:hypothetical protein
MSDSVIAHVVQSLAACQHELTQLDVTGHRSDMLALRAMSAALPRWPHLADLRFAVKPVYSGDLTDAAARIAALLAGLASTLTRLEVPGLRTGEAFQCAPAKQTALVHFVMPHWWTTGMCAALA